MHIFVTVSQVKWRAFAVEDTNRSPTKRATDLLGSKVFWTKCMQDEFLQKNKVKRLNSRALD